MTAEPHVANRGHGALQVRGARLRFGRRVICGCPREVFRGLLRDGSQTEHGFAAGNDSGKEWEVQNEISCQGNQLTTGLGRTGD